MKSSVSRAATWPANTLKCPAEPSIHLDSRDIYPAKPASLLLARKAAQLVQPGQRVLDLGTGSGVCGLWAKLHQPTASVVATDLNPAAVAVAEANAASNHCEMDCRIGDLFSTVSGESFEVILAHPPAVPYIGPGSWRLSPGMELATNGGLDGTDVCRRIITGARRYLNPSGNLLLLVPHWSNLARVQQQLRADGWQQTTLAQDRVEFFPWIEGNPDEGQRRHLRDLVAEGMVDICLETRRPTALVSVIAARHDCSST